MVPLARYKDLIVAVQRRGAFLGLDVEVDVIPETESYPIIINCFTRNEDNPHGMIFLFPPGDLMLASEELGYIVKHIRTAGMDAAHCLLLFSEEHHERVRNIIAVSGLDRHTTSVTYNRRKQDFAMNWQFPAEDNVSASVETASTD